MKAIFATLLAIPLSLPTNWEVLSFNKIPSNKVEFTKQGLVIDVQKSASPLIYPLQKPEPVFQVEVEGRIESGSLQIKDVKKQGLKGQDDFILRLGLVLEGSKTLNWAQRTVSPKWIKRLHSLAPKNKGIDQIYFLEVAQDPSLLGTQRNHYLSDLMHEEIVSSLQPNGTFHFTKTFPKPMNVLALWISTDGDDTVSTYKVVISNITLFQRPR